jgi:sulfate-transporting ATPase
MAPQYMYVMKGLTKAYPGGKKVFEDIYLSFYPGAKIGVLGPNGSGKSSLLKIMAGVDTEFHGEAWAADGVKIGYLEQEPKLDTTKTVYENVMDGLKEKKAFLDEFNEISMKFAEEMTPEEMDALIARQAELQDVIDAQNIWEIDREVERAMDALRCPPGDSEVTSLSGGEKRRVALAKLLLSRPDMLLLDEPTNHLDAESVAWLQRFLGDYAGTVVMVTHDRYFLDNVTGWILELDRGRGFPYEGNYTKYLEAKQKRMELEAKQDESRDKTLATELEWIRKGAKARQAKSKARITAYEDLLAASKNQTWEKLQIVIPTPEPLGANVIQIKNLNKGFGDTLLIEDLSFNLPRGGIVGIIGPNGAGKSTLFKMMAGRETPDSGSVELGDKVKLGYVDQSRDELDDNKTVWQEISDGLDQLNFGTKQMPSRAYVSSFNFKGPDHQKTMKMLSGGERNRVHLAKML